MMASSKGKMCFAALALLAFVCNAAMGSNAVDGRTTNQAITTKSISANGDDTASIPDFDGDGTIGPGDIVIFAGVFGSRQGDEKYDATYDLNGDGEIGFADLLIFAENFGKEAPSDDRSVLVALYKAMDGPNWTYKENWLSAAPLDEWYGVTTDYKGRVAKLQLGRNQLTGTISMELTRLTKLHTFYFHRTGLCAPLDAAFQNWLHGIDDTRGENCSETLRRPVARMQS